MEYWNPVDFQQSGRKFADGGGVDNLAITPLVQRGVRHIVCGVATVLAPDTNASHWAAAQWDVAGLFGAVPQDINQRGVVSGMPVTLFNDFMQIFPVDGYQKLYAAMAKSYRAGRGSSYRATYAVQSNAHKGVVGGWEVDVLWVFNNRLNSWERQLPAETRDMINANREGTAKGAQRKAELKNFPYVSTFDANYSPELVTLMSQLASWEIMESKAVIAEMMGTPLPPPGIPIFTAARRAVQRATDAVKAAVAGLKRP
ncbi:MAG: hypothetical protein J3K34DRAFT_444183 [Monoraphidium minutum]|nr:MAG: hypothetical protein J3K34DRAFT_444183 [Monoraphidium minutum]